MIRRYRFTADNPVRVTNAISDVTGPVRTETYGYDKLNRLTSVNYGDGQTQSYWCDSLIRKVGCCLRLCFTTGLEERGGLGEPLLVDG